MNVILDLEHKQDRSGSNEVPVVKDSNGNRKRNGIWLLTCPRSASNLFQTMLAKQSKFRHSGYWFFGPNMATVSRLPEGKWANFSEEMRNQYLAMYQDGYDGMMDELKRAQDEGKEALIKEHAVLMYSADYLFQRIYGKDGSPKFSCHSTGNLHPKNTNPTCVPDEVLLNMQPVFQIRHPGLMFSSLARAENDVKMGTGPQDPRCHVLFTLEFSRQLYEWYINTPGAPTPKVISADDIMMEPAVVRKLCEEVGMDPDELQYEWETREVPEGKEQMKRFASTIYASKGILPGYDSKDFDLEKKRKEWREYWGKEEGEFLAKSVEDALPDYEWLMERRVRL